MVVYKRTGRYLGTIDHFEHDREGDGWCIATRGGRTVRFWVALERVRFVCPD